MSADKCRPQLAGKKLHFESCIMNFDHQRLRTSAKSGMFFLHQSPSASTFPCLYKRLLNHLSCLSSDIMGVAFINGLYEFTRVRVLGWEL